MRIWRTSFFGRNVSDDFWCKFYGISGRFLSHFSWSGISENCWCKMCWTGWIFDENLPGQKLLPRTTTTYYSILLPYTTTPNYYPKLLPHTTTTYYYHILLPHTTTTSHAPYYYHKLLPNLILPHTTTLNYYPILLPHTTTPNYYPKLLPQYYYPKSTTP